MGTKPFRRSSGIVKYISKYICHFWQFKITNSNIHDILYSIQLAPEITPGFIFGSYCLIFSFLCCLLYAVVRLSVYWTCIISLLSTDELELYFGIVRHSFQVWLGFVFKVGFSVLIWNQMVLCFEEKIQTSYLRIFERRRCVNRAFEKKKWNFYPFFHIL